MKKAYKASKKWITLIAAATLFAGCGQVEETNKSIELQEEIESETSYEMTPVTLGTIEQPLIIDCNYSQTVEMDLYFDMDQEVITDVYVENGDTVEKGDILISVDVENTEKKIVELEYQLAKANLTLQQLQENKDFDLEQADILFSYTFMTQDDKEALKEQKENIEKGYKDQLIDAADRVEILTARLEETREYLKNGELHAPINGVIRFVKEDLEGSLTSKTERVISLYDADSCMYISQNVEAIPYIDPEREYTIVCGLGKNQREYTVVPAIVENWGEVMYFQLLDEEYDPNIVKNGKITIITDKAEHVLCVDKEAVHTSGERYYVYLLDEEGIRRMQFVETGLWGTDLVEIRSGLSEGDYVIK